MFSENFTFVSVFFKKTFANKKESHHFTFEEKLSTEDKDALPTRLTKKMVGRGSAYSHISHFRWILMSFDEF